MTAKNRWATVMTGADHPFDRLRHQPCPREFEPGPRHNTVLQRKKSEQSAIDGQRCKDGARRTRINGFRHAEISQKTNRLKQRGEKHAVANDSVNERNETFHI